MSTQQPPKIGEYTPKKLQKKLCLIYSICLGVPQTIRESDIPKKENPNP